jgi:hypothetical protein
LVASPAASQLNSWSVGRTEKDEQMTLYVVKWLCGLGCIATGTLWLALSLRASAAEHPFHVRDLFAPRLRLESSRTELLIGGAVGIAVGIAAL